MARSMIKTIPKVPIDADDSLARKKIDGIIKQIKNIPDIQLDADVSQAKRRLEQAVSKNKIAPQSLSDLTKVLGAIKSAEAQNLPKDILGDLVGTAEKFFNTFKNISTVIDGTTFSGLETILRNVDSLDKIKDLKFEKAVDDAKDIEQSAKQTAEYEEKRLAASKELNKINDRNKKRNADSMKDTSSVKKLLQKLEADKLALRSFADIKDENVQAKLERTTQLIDSQIKSAEARIKVLEGQKIPEADASNVEKQTEALRENTQVAEENAAARKKAASTQPENSKIVNRNISLSEKELDTYLAMIEGRDEFKGQHKRLSELRSKGANTANIKLSYLMRDALEMILEEDATASDDEVELLEKILQRRRSNEDLLKKYNMPDTESDKGNLSNIQEQITSNEKLVESNKEVAESYEKVGEAKKEASKQSTQESAEEKYNKRIAEINDKYKKNIEDNKALASNSEDWLKYLDKALDENNFKSSGKKDATDKLRSATNYLTTQRRENYENAYGSYAKEMAEVMWMRAYQEAERQGVADSVLRRYDTDAKWDFDDNLKKLQEERERREKNKDKAYAELRKIYSERDADAFAAFTEKLMPEGPQSDAESKVLSDITEQLTNKTLSFTEAKQKLEQSIETLRNMASSEIKTNLQSLVDDLKKTYDTETFDKIFGSTFGMYDGFDKISDQDASELYKDLISENEKYQASLKETAAVQEEALFTDNTQEEIADNEKVIQSNNEVADSYDKVAEAKEKAEKAQGSKQSNDYIIEQQDQFFKHLQEVRPSGFESDAEFQAAEDLLTKIALEGLSATDAIEQFNAAISSTKPIDGLANNVEELNKLESHLDSLGAEFKESEQCKAIFDSLVESVQSGGKTAAQAIKELDDAFDAWNVEASLKGAEGAVEKTFDEIPKLTAKELTAAFNAIDLKSLFSSLNIDESNFAELKNMFAELIQLSRAADDGFNVDGAMIKQFDKIIETLMRMGSVIETVDNEYQEFAKHMKGIKISYSDLDRAEYGDDWSSVRQRFQGNLVSASSGKGISADSIYAELLDLFPHLFSAEVVNQQDQLKAILHALGKAREARKNGGKIVSDIPESFRGEIESQVAKLWGPAVDASKVKESSSAIESEADAMKEVETQATSAATAKEKFSKANKGVSQTALVSADDIREESTALELLCDSIGNPPDTSGWDKVTDRITEDGVFTRTLERTSIDMDTLLPTTHIQRWVADESEQWHLASETLSADIKMFVSKYKNEAKRFNDINTTLFDIDNANLTTQFQEYRNNYARAMNEYQDALRNLELAMRAPEQDPIVMQDAVEEFRRAAKAAEDARVPIDALMKTWSKIDHTAPTIAADFERLEDSMRNYARTVANGEIDLMSFDAKTQQLTVTVRTAEGSFEQFAVGVQKGTTQLAKFVAESKKVNTFGGIIKGELFSSVGQIAGMYLGITDFIQYVRRGIESVREIDLAMTELKKVTDETDASYARFLDHASEAAGKIGSTVKDFTTVTSDFARLGYDINEAADLAEVALVYENVGDGFASVEEASASVISTIKAFGIEADDAISIVDKFNEVGNNFAITSKGIGDALQRSASSLFEAGNSLDESIGLITGMNLVVQNPEQVGTALKTLTMRLRGAKVELEEAGLDTEGMATSTSKLREQLVALTGVDIMKNENEFKNTTQILREMAAVWEDLEDIDKAAALELMGGKRQGNILASALKNWDEVERAITTATNSSGSAMAENAKYMESIQGHIDQLNNALQTFWNNLLDSEVIKFVVDRLTDLIKILDTAPGKILAVAAAVKILEKVINAKHGTKFNVFSSLGQFVATPVGGTITVITAAIAAVATLISSIKQAERQAAQLANEQAEEVKESNASLESYKDSIIDIRKQLDSETLSRADAYNAREQLIKIQDELISKYGQEAEGINLVTGAVNEQIAAIDRLAVKNANDWLNQNSEDTGLFGWGKSAIEQAKEAMLEEFDTTTIAGTKIWNDAFKSAYGDDWESESKAAAKEYQEFVQSLGGELDLSNNGIRFSNITREELIDNYDQIMNWLRNYAAKSGNKLDFHNLIGKIGTSKNEYLGENYQTHKENFESFLENTAITSYTDAYKKILDTQSDYQAAILAGDEDAARAALTNMQSAIQEASNSTDASYMKDYFASLFNDSYKAAAAEFDFKDDLQSNKFIEGLGANAKDALMGALSDLEGLNAEEILQLGKFDPNNSGFQQLTNLANAYGIELEHLISILTELNYIQSGFGTASTQGIVPIKSVSVLSNEFDKYNDALSQTNELVLNGTEVTAEYKDSLRALGITEAELNECFDGTESLVVKNADALNDLVKSSKKAITSNVRLAKAQAQLQYRDLYKQLRDLTNGENKLTDITLAQAEALYAQMNSIEGVIAKYSLLEAKLLGAANAYDKLAEAQAADSATDYGSKAEELMSALGSAFSTGELGTETAKVAFEGLIPDSVIADAETLDEKMSAAYEYFNNGTLSQIFEIEYNDEGAISGIEMTQEKVQGFLEHLINEGEVFQGTWDEFTLSPDITGLEEFADAIGVTKEVAFAFLTELERYDINWLGGDNTTLLDQLMGDDFDYQYYDKMQKLADLEMQIAKGTITDDERATYSTLIGEMESLEDQSFENVAQYARLSEQLDATKQKMIDLNKELANAEKGSDAYKRIEKDLEKAEKEAGDLINSMDELGGAPTEFQLGIAAEEAQEQIDEFKANLKDIKVKAAIEEIDGKGLKTLGLSRNADGSWSGLSEWSVYTNLEEEGKAQVEEYLNLIDGQHVIDALMGSGITTLEEHLEKIVEILEKTYEITVNTSVNDGPVQSFVSWVSGLTLWKTVTFAAQKVGDWFGLADGTAHVGGTANVQGSAHASGDWGLPKAEHNALVGELGQELVVDPHSGMYYTVGDRGAEMVDLPKDAIIFNHKQTESLLKHGYVTGRGKAYASGTAHANILQAVGNWVKETASNVVAAITGGNTTSTKSTAAVQAASQAASAASRASQGSGDTRSNSYLRAEYQKQKSAAGVDTWGGGGSSGGSSGGGGYGGGGSSGGGSSSNDTEEPEESTLDFIEFKIEEIEALIEKITAKIALFLDDTSDIIEKDSYYDQLVEAEKNKAETYLSAAEVYNQKAAELLEEVPSHYHEFAQNGALAIEDFIGEEDQEIVDAINEYREFAQKADEAEVGYLESVAQAAAYRVEQLDDIATDFENLTNQIETQSGLVDSHMNLIEESGNIISEKFYQDLMSKTIDQRKELKREKKALQKILDDSVRAGDVIVGTDEWFEMVQAIYDVDEAIVQCDIDLESYQNSINELNWESFERLLGQLDEIDSELSFIADLMTKNDWEIVDEDSNWTDKGITALGMYAQQMELAQTKSQQYGEEIKELDKLHKKGLISETEYTEKLAELKEGQRDAIGAYEDAKDAIVDLNKVRIESIKEGLDKELEAYQELIEKKKEALEADRDLYDFEKNVAEQQKNIADLQRKIAALSGDNSLSATAQRRKLEAELLEAQAELEDTYRDRQYDNTINALDKESEAYAESIDTQKEALDKSLENVDAIVTESLGIVRVNTENIMSELTELSKTYSIQLSEEITAPWEDGTAAISAYRDSFVALKDSFSAELAELIEQEKELQEQADKSAAAVLSSISKNESTVERVKNPKSSSSSSSSSSEGVVSGISGDLQYGDEGDNVKALQRALNSLGFKAGTVDGIFGDNTREALMRFQSSSKYGGAIDADGIVGAKTKKKFNIAGYAKGTTGLKKDQWAWIDEIGEELILVPGPNGTLSHMVKGTGIVPADITKNLMALGQLDPTEMLKRSTPRIGAPHITNTEINLTMDIGSVVNIEHVDHDTIPDLTKAVEKQMDKYMKNLNQQIRKFSR